MCRAASRSCAAASCPVCGSKLGSTSTVIGAGVGITLLDESTVRAPRITSGVTVQLARTAAIELVEHRIRVNLVTPGWIDTPGERKFASEQTIARAGAKLPWKRLGRPEEIARAVVFLCDPASDYITGSSLLVDGGITLPWWAHRGSGVPE